MYCIKPGICTASIGMYVFRVVVPISDTDNLYIARSKPYVTSLSCIVFSSFVVAIPTLNRSSVK